MQHKREDEVRKTAKSLSVRVCVCVCGLNACSIDCKKKTMYRENNLFKILQKSKNGQRQIELNSWRAKLVNFLEKRGKLVQRRTKV